jgi:hypothetical protein
MKWLLILLCCLPAIGISQQAYTLEGTLGKNRIYLFFEDYSTTADNKLGEVRYFYQSQLKDILLNGTRTGDRFEFFFKRGSGDMVVEKFSLVKKGNAFTGTWENEKGNKLPVTLQIVNVDSARKRFESPMVDLPDDHLPDLIRSAYLTFKADSIATFSGKKIEWFSEKHCHAPFFRLGEGFSETVKKTVNPVLEKLHYELAINQLGCTSYFDSNDGHGIEYSISIGYLDDNLLGFEIFSYWSCGGAHPDGGGQGFLIDLHSGKEYEIDDVIAFDKSVTTEQRGGFNTYAAYRTNFFAPAIFKLINSEQHFKQPTTEDDNCDYTDLERWDFISWKFTKQGIGFTPYFPRVSRNCEETFLVPFEKLKPYRNPEFPYAFDRKN